MQIKVFIQGFYNDGILNSGLKNAGLTSDPDIADIVDILLYEVGKEDPAHVLCGLLKINGIVKVDLPTIAEGNSFYISVKHRNSIQIFSANPVTVDNSTFYDFSVSGAAFQDTSGNPYPMAEMEDGTFAMWSGDVNQDGTIDSDDFIAIENDVLAVKFGYLNTDIAGVGATESASYALIENNIPKIIFRIKP